MSMSYRVESQFLRGPELTLDRGKINVFEHLYEAAVSPGTNPVINYDCEYPKHEFLSYLVLFKNLVLHGSNLGNLEWLNPIRTSTSTAHWESLEAVYACSDGIWPIFFAIVNRQKYTGSLRNACYRVVDRNGNASKLYYFALDLQFLRKRVWTDGMIYLLPKDSFEQLVDDVGNKLEEWISFVPVRSLARIEVSPQDFPFINSVRVQHLSRPGQAINVVKVDARLYDNYVGVYELDPEITITILSDKERLLFSAAGFPIISALPESEEKYFLQQINAHISFVTGNGKRADQLILQIDDQSLTARRVS